VCDLTPLSSARYLRLNPGQDSIDPEKSPRLWGSSEEAIANVSGVELSEIDQRYPKSA
jgi:hypothetical protein